MLARSTLAHGPKGVVPARPVFPSRHFQVAFSPGTELVGSSRAARPVAGGDECTVAVSVGSPAGVVSVTSGVAGALVTGDSPAAGFAGESSLSVQAVTVRASTAAATRAGRRRFVGEGMARGYADHSPRSSGRAACPA